MMREKKKNKNAKKEALEALRLQVARLKDSAFSEEIPVEKTIHINHLLSQVVKSVMDTMGVRACGIWFKDKNGKLYPRVSFGVREKFENLIHSKEVLDLVNCAMSKPDIVFIKDLLRDKRITFKKYVRAEKFKSLLAVPISVENETFGLLAICTNRGARGFTKADKETFRAIASSAALAIKNALLYENSNQKLKDEVRRSMLLFSLSRSITSHTDMDTVLDLIVEKSLAIAKVDMVSIRVFDSADNKLILKAQKSMYKNLSADLEAIETPLGKEALAKGMPRIIDDIEKDLKGGAKKLARKIKLTNLIVFPLIEGSKRLGVLYVYKNKSGTDAKMEMGAIGMISALCAMALNSAELLERVKKDYLNTIKTLASVIEANDTYTRGHSNKVMKYSLRICRKLGISGRELVIIKNASLLHDVGKVGVAQAILRKKGTLTKEEWKVVKTHPSVGAKIIQQTGFLNELIPIILHHHQRPDGNGYPIPAIEGENIPVGSRIISIADAYDAMTSSRPYRERPFTKKEAIDELRRYEGTQFDPKLAEIFIRTL